MNARRLPALALALCFLAVARLYTWTPVSFPRLWTDRDPAGFYPELTAGLLSGHLFLPRRPDPHLLALADPYDPVQNAPWRVNDLSLFHGHYYLYHGIAPVLLLFAPVRLLSGRYLTEPAAVLVFCTVGALFSLLLAVRIRQRCFPSSSQFIFGSSTAALLLAQGFYLVRTGPSQVAIAAAFCLVLASLLSLEMALGRGPRANYWLGVASLAYGLAVAARPNYVFGAAALLVPAMGCRMEGERRWPRSAKKLATALLPFAAVIAGLLSYNRARFGSPFEFGTHYVLGAWDQRAYPSPSLRNLPANIGQYLVHPGTYHAEFPFLSNRSELATGILPTVPFVWLAPLAALMLIGVAGSAGTASAARKITCAVLIVFLANFGLLLCLPSIYGSAQPTSANDRYLLDFLPALLLLAMLGAMTADHALRNRPRFRRGFGAAVCALGAVSVLSALSLDFGRWPPESYRPLARILDLPTYAWQRLRHIEYGPISIELEFPTGHTGEREPILATGDGASGDLVYVFYQDAQTLRFGFVSVGSLGPLGPPVPVKPGQPHRLDISMGSLYPSVGHPSMAKLSEQQAAYLKRHVRLLIDGSVALDAPAYFHPASPWETYIGRTPFLRGYSNASFTGRIVEDHRLALTAPDAALLPQSAYGPLLLKVRLPAGGGDGSAEPLVVTGIEQAGDFIYIRYRKGGMIQFGFDHWGGGGEVSRWLPVDFAVPHSIEITLGSLFPMAGHALFSHYSGEEAARIKRKVRVAIDGKVVLEAEQAAYEASPYDVYIGKNPLGGSTCSYAFTGEILESKRLAVPQP